MQKRIAIYVTLHEDVDIDKDTLHPVLIHLGKTLPGVESITVTIDDSDDEEYEVTH